jgi:peptidyl-prolyl cis-trans isomerase C
MARLHSHEASSAVNGGDVGYFKRGDMEASFEKAAFALAPGQVSDIIETRQGLHIIKVTDHREASTMSLEEAREDILDTLTSRKKAEIIKAYIQSLKEQAKVTYRNSRP